MVEEHCLTLLRYQIWILKQNPWPLVRERTIPTERPPFLDKIYCQLLWIEVCRVVSGGGSPTVINLSFLDQSRYFSFK
jgi:hypothetical protein